MPPSSYDTLLTMLMTARHLIGAIRLRRFLLLLLRLPLRRRRSRRTLQMRLHLLPSSISPLMPAPLWPRLLLLVPLPLRLSMRVLLLLCKLVADGP